MDGSNRLVKRFVGAMVAVSALALLIVSFAGLAALRGLASASGIEQARAADKPVAQRLEKGLSDRMLSQGDLAALVQWARLVSHFLQSDPRVVCIVVWKLQGPREQILYSNDTHLMDTSPRLLDPVHRTVLHTGEVVARATASLPPGVRVQDGRQVSKVQSRILTPNGTPLLLETYRLDEAPGVAQAARTLSGVLIVTVLAALTAQVLLAAFLVRRVGTG